MPSTFVPHKNGVHRLACLSLYKALLTRCGSLYSKSASSSNISPTSSSATLKALVRYRFKRDKKITNWQQIKNALLFGREIFEVLDEAASGSPKALQEMTQIISTTTSLLERNKNALAQILEENRHSTPYKKLQKDKDREFKFANPASYLRKPTTVPVLERPVPYKQAHKHSDGRRRVPNYFVVQGVPFLRYGRPAPLPLSLNIQNQIEDNEKLWNTRAQYEQLVQLGKLEDDWDRRLQKDHAIRPQDLHMWPEHHTRAVKQLSDKANETDDKRLSYAKKLWNVYLKEEKMAKAENAARKNERRLKWEEQQSKLDEEETSRVTEMFDTHSSEYEAHDVSSRQAVRPLARKHRQHRDYRHA